MALFIMSGSVVGGFMGPAVCARVACCPLGVAKELAAKISANNPTVNSRDFIDIVDSFVGSLRSPRTTGYTRRPQTLMRACCNRTFCRFVEPVAEEPLP
jgi:hypothetical protein